LGEQIPPLTQYLKLRFGVWNWEIAGGDGVAVGVGSPAGVGAVTAEQPASQKTQLPSGHFFWRKPQPVVGVTAVSLHLASPVLSSQPLAHFSSVQKV
jgi:hypothetical protein